MQLIPYAKILSSSKEELAKKSAPQKIRTQRAKADLEIARLEERISSLEQTVYNACSKEDLNFDDIIDALDNLALAERRLKQFREILRQLFP